MSENTTRIEDVPQSKLDDILRKVQGLLSKAEHANTGEAEADAFRGKAEELMQRYRIEESMLINSGTGNAVPVLKTWGVCASDSPFVNTLYALMYYVCEHSGVRMTYTWGPDPDNDGKRSLLAKMVGYESDLRYAIMLYVTIHMTFSGKMEPKFDAALSDEDNVYALRNSGVSRARIAVIMGWGDMHDGPSHAKVTKVYKKACERRGEDPLLVGRGNSLTLFRESYAQAFTAEINRRLKAMRTQAGVNNAGELVLANRKENVAEAFYNEFPELRPKPYKEPTAAERAAAERRYQRALRRKYTEPKYSEIGLKAGTKAAQDADLTGRSGATTARKLD